MLAFGDEPEDGAHQHSLAGAGRSDEAKDLALAGWVRNDPDGSVEVLAQGTRDQLLGLRSRLRQGPRAARVDDVEESEVGPVAGLSSFRIEGAW